MMTKAQKESLRFLRLEGCGYATIANTLGVSVNTVKSYCRRNNLSCIQKPDQSAEKEKLSLSYCQHCGKPLMVTAKTKPRRFCSDACRVAWWNSHQDSVKKKAVYHLVCAGCGKLFDSYGNKSRRYCCHACYIADRFGKAGGVQ